MHRCVCSQADASVDMAERHFYNASMEYVYLIQEVHEKKKFEFVETLLTFMIGWVTFYHQVGDVHIALSRCTVTDILSHFVI